MTMPMVSPSSQPQSDTAVSGAAPVAAEHMKSLPSAVVFSVLPLSTVTPWVLSPAVKSLKNWVVVVSMFGPWASSTTSVA